MDEVQIQLAAMWVALMLTYLLGDVLRIFSGDATPGQIGSIKGTQAMWMGAALLMLVPIAMVIVSVTLDGAVVRWVHIATTVALFGFNLIGLPTYASWYDRFLIAVSLLINVLIFVTAWGWQG
jgi:hypothetical protein